VVNSGGNTLLGLLQSWLVNLGVAVDSVDVFAQGITFSLVLILGIVANYLAKHFILPNLFNLVSYTKTKWDDTFHNRKVFRNLSHLAPVIVVYVLTPLALQGADSWIYIIRKVLMICIVSIGILVVDSILSVILDIFRTMEDSRDVPLTSIFQFVKIILYSVGGIYVVSIILNKEPLYLLSGLGAIAAVLMLVFKDALLGFVAGIQLTANHMIARGDWIEIPKYGADGKVLEVTLTTVKVQNWDNTITTLPTYALINESFKNWRGMKESGARRIKRAVNIDLNSIGFHTKEEVDRLMGITCLSEYLSDKLEAITKFNDSIDVGAKDVVNGRGLTNIGTFRAYLDVFLRNYPKVNNEMTFLIRQLAPTESGLPIEIYLFVNDTPLVNFEEIQCDIFDHIFAIIPEFGLRSFQNPSGSDLARQFSRNNLPSD